MESTPGINRDQKLGVLLLDGFTSKLENASTLPQCLTDLGCIVDTPPLARFAVDNGSSIKAGWNKWIEELQASLDDLCKQCDGIIVGGSSIGAILAPLLSVDNPKVWAVVSIQPTMRLFEARADRKFDVSFPFIDFFPRLAEKCYRLTDLNGARWKISNVSEKKGLDTDDHEPDQVTSIKQFQQLVRLLERRSERVKCPVLIMHASEQSTAAASDANYLWGLLGSRNKEIQWLEESTSFNSRQEEIANRFVNFAIKISWLNSNPEDRSLIPADVLTFLSACRTPDQKAIC